MVSWQYTYVKPYQGVHFKCVQFIICQLHANKAFKESPGLSDGLDLVWEKELGGIKVLTWALEDRNWNGICWDKEDWKERGLMEKI